MTSESFIRLTTSQTMPFFIVTGDVEPKEVFKRAKKAFGDIKNNGEIPKVKFVEPEQDGS